MRYWIGVASREHVQYGVDGSFCQLCHGNAQPLRRLERGDWIIYYSPKETFAGDSVCQQFTAIGRVTGETVYSYEMAPGFIPFRRDVEFLPAQTVSIRSLINQLNFIQDKRFWGYGFRFGHLEILHEDFVLIAEKMLQERYFELLKCPSVSSLEQV